MSLATFLSLFIFSSLDVVLVLFDACLGLYDWMVIKVIGVLGAPSMLVTKLSQCSTYQASTTRWY